MKQKGYIQIAVICFILILEILLFFYLSLGRKPHVSTISNNATQLSTSPTITTAPLKTNELNISYLGIEYSNVNIGQKVGNLVVKNIIPDPKTFKPTNSSNEITDDIVIKFNGEISVSGTYTNYQVANSIMSGQVCFNVQKQDLYKFPVIITSTSNQNIILSEEFFCFDNRKLAKNEFSPEGSSGQASIIINDFQIFARSIDGWDSATLISVSKKY